MSTVQPRVAVRSRAIAVRAHQVVRRTHSERRSARQLRGVLASSDRHNRVPMPGAVVQRRIAAGVAGAVR